MKWVGHFLEASLFYVGLVFAAGFALGIVRVLWLIPRLGVRVSELLEMPLMIGISFLAARWVVRRLPESFGPKSRLALGIVSLSYLLVLEIALTTRVRNLSLSDYLETRDPVSSAAYLLALIVFALMPRLVSRQRKPSLG
jgi:hypothetical protein